jgi:excisionase family DNA binding protein
MNEKLFNVNDVSNYINISKSAIYNYAKNQTIPSVRLNGRLLFSKEAIDLWIEENSKNVKKTSVKDKK